MLIGLETRTIEIVLLEGVSSLATTLCLGSIEKKNCISLCTTKAEYLAAGSGCTQLNWIINMLKDCGIFGEVLTLYCDNLITINISKNPIRYSRKYIDIRHHYIRNMV